MCVWVRDGLGLLGILGVISGLFDGLIGFGWYLFLIILACFAGFCVNLCIIYFVLLRIVYLPLLLCSYLVWVAVLGVVFVIGFWLFVFVDGSFVGLLFVYGLVTWLRGFPCGFV